jgi:hypothetical protein
MNKKKALEYLKQHPEVFEKGISDEDIPNISWFLERNNIPVNKVDGLKRIKNNKESVVKQQSVIQQRLLLKRVLIPVFIVLILGIFLGATAVGRAMVESAYKTVVQWFSTEIYITHGEGDSNEPIVSPNIVEYKSLDDVRLKLGIEIVSNTSVSPNHVEVETSEISIVVRSVYENQNIKVTQKVLNGSTQWSNTIDISEGQAIKEQLIDGIEFNGNYNEGVFYVVGYKDNMSIEIYSDNIGFDQFTDFIRNMQFK